MNKHGGYFGKQKDMLDFSVNLNPLGYPEVVRTFMMEQLQRLEHYPEPHSVEAREALAQHLLVQPDEVIMGNGASELIYLFARAIKPKKVLLIQPTFNEYERAFKEYGACCINHMLKQEEGFILKLDELQEQILREKPDVVVICNPNNPTGCYIETEKIKQILKILITYDGYLLVDESFYEFENQPTALSLIEQPNLFLIRSMTKFYAIAGIRLGYGIGHKTLIQQLGAHKEPWTLNGFASAIVPYLLGDLEYQRRTLKWYLDEKAYMMLQLQKISYLKVLPSHANFFLCETSILSQKLMTMLMEKGIFIRTCEDFIGLGHGYIRLALRSRVENEFLIEVLQSIRYDLTTTYAYTIMEENHAI